MAKSKRQISKPKTNSVATVESKALLPNWSPLQEFGNRFDNASRYRIMFEVYKRNGWVNRAVQVIAAAVVANGWKPVPVNPYEPDPKAARILVTLLSQPNPKDSFEDVIRKIVCDLLICGNSYLEVLRFNAPPNLGKTLAKDNERFLEFEDSFDMAMQQLHGLPQALFHLPADTMRINTDEHGKVLGYTQRIPTGEEVQFKPEQVMHFALRGVNSEVYGESPLESLEIDLAIDLYRQVYIKAQLENGSKLGYFISAEGAKNEDIARIQEWLYMTATGPNNAGKNLVSQGKLSIQAPPGGQYDSASQLGNDLKEKILTCLGVPVGKLGTIDTGAMGSTPQQGSNKTFVENTVKPLARLIERQFNLNLIPEFQVVGVQGYGVALLTEDVDILSVRATTVTNLVNAGIMTRNEARTELRLLPYDDCGNAPIVMTPQGAVSVEDIENHIGMVAPAYNLAVNGSNVIAPAQDDAAAKEVRNLTTAIKKALSRE